MRTSKYLNKEYDNGWTITHVGVARVQPKCYKGTKTTCKSSGTQTYYYIAERKTSDGKADKMVRLNAAEIVAVSRGLVTVEEIAEKRFASGTGEFTRKVSYHFYPQGK